MKRRRLRSLNIKENLQYKWMSKWPPWFFLKNSPVLVIKVRASLSEFSFSIIITPGTDGSQQNAGFEHFHLNKGEFFSYCDIIGDFCIIQTLSFVKCVEWKIQYWSFQTKYFFQWPRKCPSSCLGTICLQICLIKYKLPNADWNVKRESSPKYFFINLTSTMVDKHCICIGRVITIQNWWLPHI